MLSDKFVITGRRQLKGSGFFKVDLVSYQHLGADGLPLEPALQSEVVDRGASAAVLLFNETSGKVVLVRQLRVAIASLASPDDAWLIELPAGIVRTGQDAETPEACARREAREETGYLIGTRMERIATILPSPGGMSERIHIYFATVTDADKGIPEPDQGEIIEVVEMSVAELERLTLNGGTIDAKLMVAAQWLLGKKLAKANRSDGALPPNQGKLYQFNVGNNVRYIGYETGDIALITRRIDVWVNSENTDMLMARFFEPAVSGTIRFLGAVKHSNGDVREDTIAEALRKAVAGQIFVKPGSVVITTSGAMRETHGVRRICHAAAVHAQRGYGERGNVGFSEACTRKALLEVEALNWGLNGLLRPYRSVLFPLLGSGIGKQPASDVAEKMVDVAMVHLRNPRNRINSVHFSAFNGTDLSAIASALAKHMGDLEECKTEKMPSNSRSVAKAQHSAR